MTMDVNLMGLGMPAALASRIASGGTGPVSIQAGTSGAPTKLTGKQFVTFIAGPSTGGTVQLPALGGADHNAEVVDDFIIHNGTAGNVTVVAASGATVNINGAAYTSFTLATLKTLTFYPVTATQGFGMSS
jgi:hypothetical protein